MRGLIARILAGQAPLPPADPLATVRESLEAGYRQRQADRQARETMRNTRRFERARPKVEQLRTEHARKLRQEADA